MTTFDLHTENHWLISDLESLIRGAGDPAEFISRHGKALLALIENGEGIRGNIEDAKHDIQLVIDKLNDLRLEAEDLGKHLDDQERLREFVGMVEGDMQSAMEDLDGLKEETL